MILQILLLAAGFTLLIVGANWLVNGASEFAKKKKVSDLAIGLTIVAFGTSAPEMVVNVVGAVQGHHSIVFGNIIGSNNFNLFIILGIAGLITPIVVQSSTVWKEIPFSLFIVGMLYLLVNESIIDAVPTLGRIDGFLLLALFGLFLVYVYKQMKVDPFAAEEVKLKGYSGFKIWALILVGLGGLVAGGNLVVNNAVKLAEFFGMSQKVIGLTIIAAGTSLPELATSVVAAFKKNNDIAVGNVIGSNIFNILLVLSISSFFRPIGFDITFNTDLYILAIGTLLLFTAMFTGKKKKLDRWEAAIMLLFYIAYSGYMIYK